MDVLSSASQDVEVDLIFAYVFEASVEIKSQA